MSWLNNPGFSIAEAQQRGIDVYEVLVSYWGTEDFDHSANNMQWPPIGGQAIPDTLAAIAIGPRSTVDRCWVSYNLQKHNVNAGAETTDRLRRLSVDSPLVFVQASPTPNIQGIVVPDVGPTPVELQARKGPLTILPYTRQTTAGALYPEVPFVAESTVLPLSWFDIHNQQHFFRTEAMPPLLHLLLYLKAPPVFIPTKRFPLVMTGISFFPLNDGQEVIVAAIPTYGRKSINVMLRGVGDVSQGTLDYRIAAIRALSAGSADFVMYEEPVDQIKGVDTLTPVTMSPCSGKDLNADYFIIYATSHQSGEDVQNVYFQFTAYD